MALGSSQSSVLGLITSEGMRLVGVGELAGLGGAMALARVLGNLLYGVTSRDLVTLMPTARCASVPGAFWRTPSKRQHADEVVSSPCS